MGASKPRWTNRESTAPRPRACGATGPSHPAHRCCVVPEWAFGRVARGAHLDGNGEGVPDVKRAGDVWRRDHLRHERPWLEGGRDTTWPSAAAPHHGVPAPARPGLGLEVVVGGPPGVPAALHLLRVERGGHGHRCRCGVHGGWAGPPALGGALGHGGAARHAPRRARGSSPHWLEGTLAPLRAPRTSWCLEIRRRTSESMARGG